MLSTKNLPEPANSTVVPLSMKITWSIANPECKRTGQSTSNVKASFLAAAKAFWAPTVSSAVPVQETQPLIDFWFFGMFMGMGVATVAEAELDAALTGDLAPATRAPVDAVPVALVPVALVPDDVAVAAVVVVLDPAAEPVTVAPTLLLPDESAALAAVAPDLSTVPLTAPVAALVLDVEVAA